MTSERADLYNALEKAIGREPTRLLMERIDPIDAMATKSDLRDLRESTLGHLDAGFERIDQRFEKIDQRFEKIDLRFEKIDDRLFQFHETLRDYSRTFVTTQAASTVGAVGLAVALIKLF